MEYVVICNPNDEIVRHTEPSVRNDILVKETLKLISSPTTNIQGIDGGGGWLVRMGLIGETFFFCLVTSVSKVDWISDKWEAIWKVAESLLYLTPSSQIGSVTITLSEDLLKSLDN